MPTQSSWGELASERTLRQVRDGLAALAAGQPAPEYTLPDETVNVQEYRRPDGTTKRVVEEVVIDGMLMRTTTTNYAPVVVEAD